MPTADNIALLALLIAGASALVSLLGVYAPLRNAHDSEMLREAVTALERAHNTLTQEGKSISPPPSDRLNWLTAARQIEAYKTLKLKLKTNLYRQLCLEHEDHWRHQFYLSILKNRINTPKYFIDGKLEPRSTLIIYDFASWPEGKEDSIDTLDIETLYKQGDFLQGNIGLRLYLETFPEYGGIPKS